MDSQRALGIVLRRQPVMESSLLITWFTRECGKLKTLAKGARRPKSPLAGRLDLFYLDELVFLPSRRSDLHLLQECSLENPHARLRESVTALTAASYAGELVDLVSEIEDPQPALFDRLTQVLAALGADPAAAGVGLLWFELQVLAVAGWAPQWESSTAVGRVLQGLAATTGAGAQRVRLSAEQLAGAREMLWRFWDDTVGQRPRSRRWLEEKIGH